MMVHWCWIHSTSVDGQAAVVTMAQELAINPRQLSFKLMERNKAYDPIEVTALTRSFREMTPKRTSRLRLNQRKYCHLDAAAVLQDLLKHLYL